MPECVIGKCYKNIKNDLLLVKIILVLPKTMDPINFPQLIFKIIGVNGFFTLILCIKYG